MYWKVYNFGQVSRIQLYLFCITWKDIYNHKWCMHSILPVAPRVKQPALYFHTPIDSQPEETISSLSRNTKTLTTLGCGTRPVSIGSRRRRAKCTEHFGAISVFVQVRLAFAKRGNKCVLRTWSEIVPNVTGHYVSQQCQYALVSLKSHAWKMKINYLLLRNELIWILSKNHLM